MLILNGTCCFGFCNASSNVSKITDIIHIKNSLKVLDEQAYCNISISISIYTVCADVHIQ